MPRSAFMVRDTPLVDGLPVGWIHRVECEVRPTGKKGEGTLELTQSFAHDPEAVKHMLDSWSRCLADAVQRKYAAEVRARMQAQESQRGTETGLLEPDGNSVVSC